MWPNLWDVTAGGHVLAGELGYQTAIRETNEEIGVLINKNSLEFIGSSRSENIKGSMIDRHYNEYYIMNANIDTNDITLQEEEVQNISWFDRDDIINKVNNNYDTLTAKVGCWEYLIKYFEIIANDNKEK